MSWKGDKAASNDVRMGYKTYKICFRETWGGKSES